MVLLDRQSQKGSDAGMSRIKEMALGSGPVGESPAVPDPRLPGSKGAVDKSVRRIINEPFLVYQGSAKPT